MDDGDCFIKLSSSTDILVEMLKCPPAGEAGLNEKTLFDDYVG